MSTSYHELRKADSRRLPWRPSRMTGMIGLPRLSRPRVALFPRCKVQEI